MTASSSQLSVINQALLRIGARATVANLNEGSTEANAAKILYQSTFEMMGRAAHWGCLRRQKTLSLLAAAKGTPENQNGTTLPLPPSPWLYQYAEPVDCLQVRFLLPTYDSTASSTPLTTASYTSSPSFPNVGQIPFAMAYAVNAQQSPIQVILTNQSQAQVVYTVNEPNPVIWDSLFSQAMIAALAAFFVPALSLNLPLMDAAIKTADALVVQARVRDGVEGFQSQNRNADWMTARMNGAPLIMGNYYNQPVPVSWPSIG